MSKWNRTWLYSLVVVVAMVVAPGRLRADADRGGDDDRGDDDRGGDRDHGRGGGDHDRGPDRVAFRLSDGNTMAGYVYREERHAPFVIMVHGASDTHTVFDFAPGYRAARLLADRGYGVMTVDRVGYGASSHPDGDSLSFATAAHQLHDVIHAVHGGALGFRPPAIIVLGPSVGADITLVEAGTYHDVDGVVICANTDQLQPALFQVDIGALFAQGPYFDFGVEFRTQFFYALQFADPRIVVLDNATRSLVPRAEIMSALGGESAPFRAAIDVPVFLLQAEDDHLFVPENDTALFTSSPDVTFTLLHDTGHKMFSHRTTRITAIETVANWLHARF
jgi:pimeloyl-ACP methyl ester carboxylesterase